jgi:hypothetical protein
MVMSAHMVRWPIGLCDESCDPRKAWKTGVTSEMLVVAAEQVCRDRLTTRFERD